MSETLSGVKQLKIGDILLASETVLGVNNAKSSMLLASERSERDNYRANTIENRGCLFVYILVVCLSTNGERALNYTIVKFDFNN